MHDFLTVGAAHPLQEAAAVALRLGSDYYDQLAEGYEARRDYFCSVLDEGFRVYRPIGAYYIMTDISQFGFPDDVTFARHLVEAVGVATVPGSAFYSRPELGRTQVRFCFPKKMETLQLAAQRLRTFVRSR